MPAHKYCVDLLVRPQVRQGISNVRAKIAKTGLSYVRTQLSKLSPKDAKTAARAALNPNNGELYWAHSADGKQVSRVRYELTLLHIHYAPGVIHVTLRTCDLC